MVEGLLTASTAIGIVISFLFSMIVGIYPGGIIVPGYIALYLDRPLDIVVTFAVSWFAYFIVSRLSYVVILYGRRKTALLILTGFLLGYLSDILVFGHSMGGMDLSAIDVIGHIIPGLIASGIASYGVITTLSSVITCSVIVKLLLVLLGL
uniref:Poly-gamma-glutamate biosynthesis protein PgsC/CapC n=1 Tax=Candidatus Kentrum sp. FM TaxID=2126340 RepID=A0A450TMU1_9GAMM|nr:MAG: poly-gamma-glutamate biosynthesis protein PgsC/CapC [Candidatus Kentron sp. FM]VFJ69044.1 MAG: poly-gamma-glutamate biosynthesis protein PgsC/CapC [Candidatus Kentron sp. FM]VFK17766.1 MAG: poly-gamma-glutamate biosynthesis protein PgsC/CapC [Candidatus Kentron sp. FM]